MIRFLFFTQAVRLVADYKINLRGLDYDCPEYEKLKSEVMKPNYIYSSFVHWVH